MAEYIDLNNTEVLAEAGENAKLVVEEDGELKRIPASAVGGKKYILSTTDMFTFTATNFTYDELRAELEAGNVVDVFVTASEPEGKGVYRALAVAAGTDKIYIMVGNGLNTFGIIMEPDGSAYIPN